ncbi:esterase E4-like isoform X1 [Macrosteles quadrilineatus]|uniref:esterase E4-like isoform X1 n=1 Tax=Macrosteles quadrilineatus TaxID=74068 RepID=UPI0023E2B9DB|nr:esterase E4-like isoform X1 [Macrosteles quadrilineatus]
MAFPKTLSSQEMNQLRGLILTLCWFIFSLRLARADCTSQDVPRVPLTTGCVEGIVKTTVLGRKYYSFQGIPYAAPPTGKLRFKAPQPTIPWSGVLKASKEPPACLQPWRKNPYPITFSEDCLYLNVFTPYLKPPNGKLLPVIVWIHGGKFYQSSGSTYKYGPDFLLMKDVILVNINYRLGIFGFLNLNSSEAQGNASLKDRIAALRWVQREISKFGGDPTKVTIVGGSSGGSDVMYLYISPLAKGLFHRAITQSGSALGYVCFLPSTLTFALKVADSLGCPTHDPQEVVDCLRGIHGPVLAEQQAVVGGSKGLAMPFVPSIETDLGEEVFLPDSPQNLISQSGGVPYMMGFNNAEGLMYVNDLTDNELKNIKQAIVSYLPEHMLQNSSNATISEMATQIGDCYFGQNISIYAALNGFVEFATDRTFAFSILKSAEALSEKAPVYLYYFTFEGDFQATHSYKSIKLSGVGHGDELGYIFYRNYTIANHNNFSSYPRSMEMMEKVVNLWTNFAIHGNPTPLQEDSSDTKWDPVTPSINNHLIIDEKLEMVHVSLLKERETLWENLYLLLFNQESPQRKKGGHFFVTTIVGLILLFSVILAITYYIQYWRERNLYFDF